ncbi:cation:proton antiporter [Marivibrio halodurans]|uniref:Cation:proton antiporter n=1 Tax=Marivibrio halodurans TaxID=2039722 RepID=A0A8J7V1H9_9PROT|nr:cation:proton antiporter [Marivibrio halodurans]MBP5857806.1 cation:proton antiporter [Marivibrio halodurans]
MHGPDLTGIALVAVAATLCGMAMVRLKQPPIVGYILAGVILGPSALGLVENRESIRLLAELGVIMLLYFVGMELSLRAFRHIWKIALITSMVQILASVGAVYGIAQVFDWPFEWALLFGFCLALSSTAVAINVLEGAGELRTTVGKVAVGVLIAQDLAVAPMLVVTSNLSGEGGLNPKVIVEVALSIGLLLLFILVLTRRTKVNLPFHRLTMDNPALTPLAALTWCFAFATVAGLIGLSPAFGAFLAGLVVGNSAQRQTVHENAVPVQAVLMMIFFLSVGLLIDLPFVWENFWLLIGLWAFVTLFKTALNTALLRLQGQTWQTSFQVSLVIGQLGEFSFLLGAAGLSAAVIDSEVYRLIVALTVISLMTSPIYTDLTHRLGHRAARNIESLGGLLRFAYVREWQLTKRLSRTVYALGFRYATAMHLRVEKERARQRARRTAGQRLSPDGSAPAEGAETDALFDPRALSPVRADAPKPGPRRARARAHIDAAREAAERAVSERKAGTKKAVPPKSTAKKTAAKKGASRKTEAKSTVGKAAGKKQPAKKASPTKGAAKKAAPKKTMAKKAPGGKTGRPSDTATKREANNSGEGGTS